MKPAGRVRGFGGMAVHRGTVRAESSPRFGKGSVQWVICTRLGNDPIRVIPRQSDIARERPPGGGLAVGFSEPLRLGSQRAK
jgi:hypothetical protein